MTESAGKIRGLKMSAGVRGHIKDMDLIAAELVK
jgi:hypothetical protein